MLPVETPSIFAGPRDRLFIDEPFVSNASQDWSRVPRLRPVLQPARWETVVRGGTPIHQTTLSGSTTAFPQIHRGILRSAGRSIERPREVSAVQNALHVIGVELVKPCQRSIDGSRPNNAGSRCLGKLRAQCPP